MDNKQQQVESPGEVLHALARKHNVDVLSLEFAKLMDSQDPLRSFRDRFCYPKKGALAAVDPELVDPKEECVYLCGNSLGLKPRTADTYMQEQLDKWGNMGSDMHFCEPLPGALCDQYGREEVGRLVGADPSSVMLMNSLTVNLNLLMLSFYQPTPERYKILIEAHGFPSDRYAMVSQVELRGFNPKDAVLEIKPRPGEHTLRTVDILQVLEEEGSSIAVVCLGGVQYYTGQKFDMERITKAAQEQGCLVGWDLAHAIGNVSLHLDQWGVDFACWCTYKYLNSGPGSIGGAYVNKRHDTREAPHLRGWWSNKETTRFFMLQECDVATGVDSFRMSNPSPLMITLVKPNLEIFEEARMERLLQKQFLLTGYLELQLKTYFSRGQTQFPEVTIITPEDVRQRGCQLSLSFSINLEEVHQQIQKRGVMCDVRKPNVMRIAPTPLYNSFYDVHRFIDILKDVFAICKTVGA